MLIVSRRIRAVVGQGCCLALLMTIVTATPAHAAAKFQPRPLQRTPSVAVRAVAAKAQAADPAAARAGSVVIDLPRGGTDSAAARAGDLPVSASTPGSDPVGGKAVTRARVETL